MATRQNESSHSAQRLLAEEAVASTRTLFRMSVSKSEEATRMLSEFALIVDEYEQRLTSRSPLDALNQSFMRAVADRNA
jgi:hypothetical protein